MRRVEEGVMALSHWLRFRPSLFSKIKVIFSKKKKKILPKYSPDTQVFPLIVVKCVKP